jgi:hypothetical protein
MNTCTKALASKEQKIEERYIKNLAASMQRTRDMLVRELFTSRPKRFKQDNSYIHGALNAIHKITKTV